MGLCCCLDSQIPTPKCVQHLLIEPRKLISSIAVDRDQQQQQQQGERLAWVVAMPLVLSVCLGAAIHVDLCLISSCQLPGL
jgi:hypothetical protein